MSTKNIEDIYPLSPMQEGMLFHALGSERSDLYTQQIVFTQRGEPEAIERAFRVMVDRHPALRTAFIWERVERPIQVVRAQARLPVSRRDLRGQSAEEQAEAVESHIRADRARGFDVSRAPLVRLSLLQLADDAVRVVWSRHHLVLDGWSTQVILSEVFALLRTGEAEVFALPEAPPFSAYLAWLAARDKGRAEAFWRGELAGFSAPTPLPRALPPGPRHPRQASHHEVFLTLSEAETESLVAFARRERVTLSTLVHGAWALLLHRYSGERDVVFGSTASGRTAEVPGVDRMVGLLINTLAVRVSVARGETVSCWLSELQGKLAAMLEQEHTSLSDVQPLADVPRGQPLFESMVVFESVPVEGLFEHPSSKAEIRESALYPLTLLVVPGKSLVVRLDYEEARLDEQGARAILQHLVAILRGLALTPTGLLADVPMLSDAERERVFVAWNSTEADYPKHACIHDLFDLQAAREPDAVALRFEGESFTYGQVQRRSNQLAHDLIARGVGPGAIVGVLLRRSPTMVIAMLAAMKAGAAYLPLDPAYPDRRIEALVDDARPSVLLTERALLRRLPANAGEVVLLDATRATFTRESEDSPEGRAKPSDAAYVIYTSGSTGEPKGVVGLHLAAVNRFAWMWRAYPFAPGEVCCQKTSPSFVDSVWEIWGPLLAGIPSVLLSEDAARDPSEMTTVLAAEGVTRIVLVPSLLRVMLDVEDDLAARLPSLHHWVVSGEALSPGLCRAFEERLPGRTLLNLYGCTEVAADATYCEPLAEADRSVVPIGKPIANLKAFVLGPEQEIVPVGATGDLYIGGVGLSQGYLRRPDCTAERFIERWAHGSNQPERLYATGDRARRREDGALLYAGRRDHQVKVRGHRVELAEVEATLRAFPGVEEAIAGVSGAPSGEASIVAHLLLGPGEAAASLAELHAHAKRSLPQFMVPSRFFISSTLPLTPNGKVDRENLAAFAEAVAINDSSSATQPGPLAPDEAKVARVFADVLGVGVESIGAGDDFFLLGGHSLLGVRLVTRLRQVFGVALPVRALFDAPTVRALAERLEECREAPVGR